MHRGLLWGRQQFPFRCRFRMGCRLGCNLPQGTAKMPECFARQCTCKACSPVDRDEVSRVFPVDGSMPTHIVMYLRGLLSELTGVHSTSNPPCGHSGSGSNAFLTRIEHL